MVDHMTCYIPTKSPLPTRLPPDVLQRVGELLREPDPRDRSRAVVALMAVCRELRELVLSTGTRPAVDAGMVQCDQKRAALARARAVYRVRSLSATCPRQLALCAEQHAPDVEDMSLLAGVRTDTLTALPSCLAACTALRRLSLSHCTLLEDLTGLERCPRLESLRLSGCPRVADLTPVGACLGLCDLDIQQCGEFHDLAPLAGHPRLRTLKASHCPRMSDLSPLAGCDALRVVWISACPAVRRVAPLAGCPALATLYLAHCRGVEDLRILADARTVETIYVVPSPTVRGATGGVHIISRN